jgi:hypothetical protein
VLASRWGGFFLWFLPDKDKDSGDKVQKTIKLLNFWALLMYEVKQ